MPRLRTGFIQKRNGKHIARLSWTDKSGKRRTFTETCDTRTQANKALQDKLKEIEDTGQKTMDAARMTFDELADHYLENYVVEPEYVDGRKVIGMRTHQHVKLIVKMLKGYWGATRIQEITHGDVEKFKRDRIRTPVLLGRNSKTKEPTRKQRTMATVNRELSILRRILHIAQKQGWIKTTPFAQGDSLISPADEKKRDRIMSREEERAVLGECVGKNSHIKPIIICALDTGMRAGEIFSLKWEDVDLPNRRINIKAMNTKTMKAREVPISSRLAAVFRELREKEFPLPDKLIFGITDNIKKSWRSVCKRAGVVGLKIHDLRHTAATRLIQGGLPQAEVARILGHSSISMTFRYVNADDTTVLRAGEILDRMNSN